MSIIDLIPGGRLVQGLVLGVIAAALIGAVTWAVHSYNEGLRADGRAQVQAKWDADKALRTREALAETEANAKETKRRLEAQQSNQERQNEELAIAHAAADRNARDAERVRQQADTAANQWSHTLRNSPTSADLAAAADTIRVQADLFGRADRRAGILAAYADAARAAGLKCERDYDSLTGKP